MSTEAESGNTTATATQGDTSTATPVEGQTQASTSAAPAVETKVETPAVEQPIEYQPFKVPEGVKLQESISAKFTEVAKTAKLPQEAAQKFIDELAPLIAKENAAAMQSQLAEMRKGWTESVKTDKEIGGEKSAENLAVASSVFQKFGTPELKQFLDASGLGDHPELIRWAFKVGKAMGEDTIVKGALSDGQGLKDPAAVLYDAKPA